MAKLHDKEMPRGWHTIKCVLLDEMRLAATFNLCVRAADALFHARLVGESSALQTARDIEANGGAQEQAEAAEGRE